MIWTQFQQAIVARLAGDAYFTALPAIGVFAEEDEAELTDTSLEAMRKLVHQSLTTSGAAIVVSEPDFEITDSPDMYQVTVTIAVFENRTANRNATTGARRSGKNIAAVCHWLLMNHPLLADLGFTRLKVRTGNYVGEEDGIKVRELVAESRIAFDTVRELMIDAFGNHVVTENGEQILINPSTP
jgi:hypothetical protein